MVPVFGAGLGTRTQGCPIPPDVMSIARTIFERYRASGTTVPSPGSFEPFKILDPSGSSSRSLLPDGLAGLLYSPSSLVLSLGLGCVPWNRINRNYSDFLGRSSVAMLLSWYGFLSKWTTTIRSFLRSSIAFVRYLI